MVSAKPENDTAVPAGFTAVPLHSITNENPLRLSVLMRDRADAVGGKFVLLRDLADTSVYLGCITDAADRVWDWMEVWVQNPDKLHDGLVNLRQHLSNDVLDERWASFSATFRETDPENYLATGFEGKHPEPLPGEAGAVRWKLCQDDSLLRAAGLPAYSTSLFRYLQNAGDASAKLVPVVRGAPENDKTAPLNSVIKDSSSVFNAHCGLMLARSFAPIPLEEYVDILGGKAWAGIDQGATPMLLNESYRALENPIAVQQSGAHLFLGTHGHAGRLLETFHLKIQLLTSIVRQVRAFVQKQQLPFLNLSGDSFRVKLSDAGAGLPFLWTARATLVKPSQAFALPVETSDFRYFIPARSNSASIYLPEGAGQPVQSSGTVRLRKVLPPERGLTTIEGTLVFEDRLKVSQNDLLWIRLPLQSGRVDLYGHLYASEGLASGEARFRTVPQKLADAEVAALRSAEGASFARTSFDVVPLLSSPSDLYSLGVLAARTLLVNESTTLAVAVDEILSLARQLANDREPQHDLKWRVRKIFDADPRWIEALGPHHLFWNGISAKDAASILPMELWCEVIGIITRLFPGMGADSVCRDFGDAPSLALETVFDQPVTDFERLLTKSRSLIVIDWKFNREIHEVISGFLEKA